MSKDKDLKVTASEDEALDVRTHEDVERDRARALEEHRNKVRSPTAFFKRLDIEQRPGYKRRIANESKVKHYMDVGWKPVLDTSQNKGQQLTQDPSALGSGVLKVPVGGGKWGIVMEIPNEFWEHNQKVKYELVKATEDMLKANLPQGTDSYNTTKIERK